VDRPSNVTSIAGYVGQGCSAFVYSEVARLHASDVEELSVRESGPSSASRFRDRDFEPGLRFVRRMSSTALGAHHLSAPEDALAYIGEDELVDVTPESIRLHKKVLGPEMRI
jgi:hypothetical protein